MTLAFVAISGWAAAGLLTVLDVRLRRSVGAWREAAARAVHEIRGPLTAARLGLELTSRAGELAPARVRAVELQLSRAAVALQDLTDAWSGRRRRRPAAEVDVVQLLGDSVEAWRGAAARAGADLRVQWKGAAAHVWGDRVRLAQAAGNLIANAIEHGGGEVVVSGRADAQTVRIEVTDDGPGLPAPVGELVRRAAGTVGERGHGLAIASAIANDHGGRLAAAPSNGGARLVLELPVGDQPTLRAPVAG